MAQKIIKVGSSAAVTLSKHSLEELGSKVGDKVKIIITRGEVKIIPARQATRHDKIARLTYDFIERYRKDLEALANE